MAVLLIDRLTLSDSVADGCESKPLVAFLEGVEVTLGEFSGRIATFAGVAEVRETEPFALPLMA